MRSMTENGNRTLVSTNTRATGPPVLIGRGRSDTWYSADTLAADLQRLRGMAVDVDACVFDGGHEWTDEFAAAAGRFLNRIDRKA